MFFQNNTYFETISLVSIVSRLFRKLTSRVCWTWFHYSKSSIKDSISMKINAEIESLRLYSTNSQAEITKKEANQQRRRKQQTQINKKQGAHSSSLWTFVAELLSSSTDDHHHHQQWFDFDGWVWFLGLVWSPWVGVACVWYLNHFCDLWVCSWSGCGFYHGWVFLGLFLRTKNEGKRGTMENQRARNSSLVH